MKRLPTARRLAPALALVSFAACASEAFVSGSGDTGGVTGTSGAGGSTGHGGATSAGGAGTGGATTVGTGGATGSGGSAGGATGGGGSAGGSGGGDAGPPPCGPCDPGKACDPGLGQCVDGGFLRVLTSAKGVACAYTQKKQPVWHSPPLQGLAATQYFIVPPGALVVTMIAAASCPPSLTPMQEAGAAQVAVGPQAFYTLVDIGGARAVFEDGLSGAAGPPRARYVDAMESAQSAPLDFSSALPSVAPLRIQSGGLLQPGVGPQKTPYQDLTPDHEPTPNNPLVLTAPAPGFHFLNGPVKLQNAYLTAYAFDTPDGPRTVLCEDGSPQAACQMLTAATGKPGACFAKHGQPAPSTCVQCGVRFTNAVYTCEGSATGQYYDMILDPMCACRPGEPAWNRCVGQKGNCADFCGALGRSCAPECSVNGACVGSGLGMFENEQGPNGTECTVTGGCGAVTSMCNNAFNTFCCCK